MTLLAVRPGKPAPRFSALAAALLMGVAAACTPDRGVDEMLQADALARTAIEQVRVNGLAGVQPHLAPETARSPQLAPEVQKMRDALPSAHPDTVQLVASEVELGVDRTVTRLRYIVRSPEKSAEAEVWVERRGGSRVVETLRISGLP